MKPRLSTLAMLVALGAAGSAQAAEFTFSGNINFHNDVIQIPFYLDTDANDVKVWTDSYLNGLNFDPNTAVWSETDTGWSLIRQNDDNSGIAPNQTIYDSGLTFSSLTAGSYLFTIATYNNFANGNTFAQGFSFDGQRPIPLANWCQPDNHCNMGTSWQAHLYGVDGATAPVPEPGIYAMFLAGLGIMGAVARRKEQQQG